MKRLLFILFLFSKCFAQPATPATYNFINAKYDWLEGKFRTLHVPSGGGTQTLYGGWIGAGALYWDSVGKVLSIWDGAAWQNTGGGATVGTYAQRIALSASNGNEFFQTDDGRDAPAGKYFYLDTIWNYTPLANEDFFSYFTDFSGHAVGSNTTANYGFMKAGTLGAGSFISFSAGNDMFYGNFGTGTTTTGFAKIGSDDGNVTANTGFKASKESLYFKTTIQSISQKANLNDNFTIDAGFTNVTSGTPALGYFFRYDSTTSANWLYKNGSNSLTATSVAVAAATPYKLEVFVRSDSVFYWINNNQVAAEATTSNTTFLQPLLRILKSLGGTSITMTVDYIKLWARLTATQTR